MIALGSPIWLAGLAFLPLVRELHRFRGDTGATRVPAIFLWSGLPDEREGTSQRAPPDPVWRRRALALALMLAALSDPGWRAAPDASLDCLVDHRPSLLTLEPDGHTRAEQAAARIAAAAVDAGIERIRLLPLGGGTPVLLPAKDRAGITRVIADWSIADRPAAPVDPGPRFARRWLVSDGSAGSPREQTDAAADLGPFERVIATGRETENQGITRLAATPAADDPETLRVLVELANTGLRNATRTLVLGPEETPLGQLQVQLPPGETRSVVLDIAAGTGGPLEARVHPADALALDDRLGLDPTPLGTIRVAISPGCEGPIRALVAALPALSGVPAGVSTGDQLDAAPGLRIWCDDASPPDESAPTLWLPPGTADPAPHIAIRWAQTGQDQGQYPGLHLVPPLLDPAEIRPISLASNPAGRPLLLAGERPLILEQAGGRRIMVLLDTGPAVMALAQTPLILRSLIARLIGRDPLRPEAVSERPLALLRVVPGAVPAATPHPVRGPTLPLWPIALLGAIGVLGLDLTHSMRRGGR